MFSTLESDTINALNQQNDLNSLCSQDSDLQIKPEPLLLSDAEIHALAKDRQKKDNHNMSKSTYKLPQTRKHTIYTSRIIVRLLLRQTSKIIRES